MSEAEKKTLRKLNTEHGYEYAKKAKKWVCDHIDTPSTQFLRFLRLTNQNLAAPATVPANLFSEEFDATLTAEKRMAGAVGSVMSTGSLFTLVKVLSQRNGATMR